MSQQAKSNTCFRNKLDEKFSEQKQKWIEGMEKHPFQETSANKCEFCWCNGEKTQKKKPPGHDFSLCLRSAVCQISEIGKGTISMAAQTQIYFLNI